MKKNQVSKIQLKDVLDLNSDEKSYEYLFEKVFKLGEEIIKLKNLKYEVLYENDKDMELFCMREEIYYNSILFESYRSLVSYIRDWYVDHLDEEFRYTTEYKSEPIVKVYNELIDDIEEYKETKARIEKEGVKNLEENLVKGLREIFCKMLDYKNRKYNKDGSIFDLISELNLCYSDYKWMFDETYTMLRGKCIYRDTERDDFWQIKADDVEYISNLEFTYNFFAKNEDNYKNYTQYYEDITLKEGQTRKDLYFEQLDKLQELFLEMLEYIKVEIPEEEKNNYYYLRYMVGKHFPYFYHTLIMGANEYSYIDSIRTEKRKYEYLKSRYKNYEEDIKRYNKEQEELQQRIKEEAENYDELFLLEDEEE